jgi:hypothetical protein
MRPGESEFAADLEAAVSRAQASGLDNQYILLMIGSCVGYSVANGCPELSQVQEGVDLIVDVIINTAERVYAATGGGMQTAGTA